MNINIPPFAREHFWKEPPPDSIEFWSFRFKPPCNVGDKLVFRFDGVPVARAIVHEIQAPGLSACESTGKFSRGWKVFWLPESFVDLRESLSHKTDAVTPRIAWNPAP